MSWATASPSPSHLGTCPVEPAVCPAGQAPSRLGPGFRAPGIQGRDGHNHGGATCEGKSVLLDFLFEVLDFEVPFLQQLVQPPVLVHGLPELTTKLLHLVFKCPARQRPIIASPRARAQGQASAPGFAAPRGALGGDKNWSVQNRNEELGTPQ